MKDIIIVLLAATVVSILGYIIIQNQPQGRYYDCGMAEWHPDIPNEVKEECRRRRQENFKQDRNIGYTT
jgi:hypothetical protein